MKKIDLDLISKFYKIKAIGWIRSKRNGPTGIGYTFEELLNKKEDNKSIPDFKDIEIKTKRYFSKGYITLINITPNLKKDSIKYIYNKYSYKNPKKLCFKTFNGSINTKEYSKIGPKNYYKLEIDYLNKILYLNIYDNNYNLIDKSIGWTFTKIEERINKKLNKLAIITTLVKKINKEEYYNYVYISIYKRKKFEEIIKALEMGKIRITFKIDVYLYGNKYGKIHDRGTGFDINQNDLDIIYEKIYTNKKRK